MVCHRVGNFFMSAPVHNHAAKAFWYDRSVFVTGATGLLGPWLIQQLVDAGANLTVLVRDVSPRSHLNTCGYLPRLNQVFGDLTDRDVLERALNEYEVDSVFHLGAQAIVGVANRNPLSTFESNIRGTWNLLEAARRNPHVQRIIVASSDKAYGNQPQLPYTEETPLQGWYPYDVSKSCVDLLAQSYQKSFGLPVGIVRCGNFFGGGDLNFNRIVPGTIKALLHDRRPVIRSDGTLIRDYFYIEDVADAYRVFGERLREQGLEGQAFNFASGNPMTVLEVVRSITNLMQRPVEPEILNIATNEIPAQYLSAEKARRVLGWSPQVGIEEGLRRTIRWYEEHFRQRQVTGTSR